MKASFRSIAGWILASVLIFASLHRSEAITFSTQPEKPFVVVVGVNDSDRDLIWEYISEAGETVQSVLFQRNKPGDITPVTLAARLANTGFTVLDPYGKDYDANLNNRLRIKKVTNDQEYIYTIVINYSKNNSPQPSKRDQVSVVVKVPPKISVVPQRQPTAEIGKNLTLTCNASGDPHPQILWTIEGVASKDYNVSGYKFHLVEVKRTDVGSYKCTANNGYGIATSLSVVSVKCPTNGCQTKTVGITITDDQKWPWKSAYNNTDSIEYKKLQSSLTSAIARIYTKNPVKQLYGQAIVELRSGSVIVAYVQLLFGTGVNDPLQPLRDEVAKGKLGPFNVNRVLVVVPTIPPSTTLTQETTTGTRAPPNNAGADTNSRTNSGLSTVAVTGIVIGILLITVVALTTYIFWFKRQGRRDDRQNKKHEEIGVSHFHNVVETEDERNSDNVATSGLRQRDIEIREVSQSLERSTETNTSHYSEISEYAALHPATRSWEVPKENVTIEKVIGEGAFGQVAQGTASQLRGGEGTATVAIKMLKAGAPESDRKDLLSELEVMKTLKAHRHVIKLLGCVTESDPILVIIEYVPYGDLLGYLRKSRGLNDFYYKDPDVKPQTSLTSQQLMKFSWQVADGMSYLSSRNIIHRDLAARNVLVGEQETCKVTDFGMARDVHQENIYEKKTMGRIPVKWTAYEALMFGQYTTKSDVWSFGVVLYEIFTIGGAPYPRTNGRKMADLLLQGYRMPKPNHVDSSLYQIMLNCWQEDPDNRPTFENLRRELKQMENQHKRLISMKDYNKKLYENVEDLIF